MKHKSHIGNMEVITINVPKNDLKLMARLIEKGLAPSRSEIIRIFIRDGIPKYIKQLKEMEGLIPKDTTPPDMIRIPNGDGTFKTVDLIRRLG